MSVYGKFFSLFTPGDWQFSWVMNWEDGSTGTEVLTCSFSSGESAGDIMDCFYNLKTRAHAEMIALSSLDDGTLSLSTACEVFPLEYSKTFPTVAGTTITVLHSTSVFGFGGSQIGGVGNHSKDITLSTINWSSCSDALLNVLGFDQSETVTNNHTITAVSRPRYCWFPGVDTYGHTAGAGVTSDTGWIPVDAHSRIVSGGGNMRITGPSRMQYKRRLRFEALKRAEVLEARHKGPLAFFDIWATSVFRWYPDRDYGTMITAGTRGDPGPTSYHTDSDCSYWQCALAGEPRITQGSDPDWFTVTIDLNGEPA